MINNKNVRINTAPRDDLNSNVFLCCGVFYIPKPFFAYVRRKCELKQENESEIVNGVEQTQPAVLYEAFRSYFNSTPIELSSK